MYVAFTTKVWNIGMFKFYQPIIFDINFEVLDD